MPSRPNTDDVWSFGARSTLPEREISGPGYNKSQCPYKSNLKISKEEDDKVLLLKAAPGLPYQDDSAAKDAKLYLEGEMIYMENNIPSQNNTVSHNGIMFYVGTLDTTLPGLTDTTEVVGGRELFVIHSASETLKILGDWL